MKKILLLTLSISILSSCATPEFGNDDYGYMNQDYSKDGLINSKFNQSVQAMNTSPYTWQGEEYEETGNEETGSPFMSNGQNLDDGLYPDSAYVM